MTGDGPKMVHFGPKMAWHGRLFNVPKWSKRVQNGQPNCFDQLGPFLAHLDPFGQFQIRNDLLSQMDKVGFPKYHWFTEFNAKMSPNEYPMNPIYGSTLQFRFPSFFRCLVERTFPFFYLSPSSWSHDKLAGQGRMFSSLDRTIFVLILDFLMRFSFIYSRHHIIITINAVYITIASPNLGFFDEVKFYMMSLMTSGRILW